MDHQDIDEKLWSRIAAAFLRAPSRPSAYETEAFVSRFMGRLEQPAAPPAASEPPWFAAGLRWLVPVMSVALAASALLITRPDPIFTPPDDLALLADASGVSAQAAEPTTDDLVAMVMEKE
jgi:hypothetical protein